MDKSRRFGRWNIHNASIHHGAGSGNDHILGPPALAQNISINATKNGSFRMLSDDIRKMIFSHLDYQSLIFLSQASHHFYEVARPEQASPQDKFQFVMRAEKEFKQHFENKNSPGNLACYFCYRVFQADCLRGDQALEAFVDCNGEFVFETKPENATKYTKVQLRRYCKT